MVRTGWIAILSLLVFIPGAIGQDQPALSGSEGGRRPVAASRIVRVFDFEERPGNPTDLPLGWFRGQSDARIGREREGFPSWNLAELSSRSAASGEWSAELPTRGGNTSLRLNAGVLSIFSSADYVVAARVRTDGLQHARARLVARLLDEQGVPVPGGEQSTPPAITDGQWTTTTVEVRGGHDAAAFLEIELLLEQPEKRRTDPRTGRSAAVTPADYSGSAFFDDVTVIQIPRVEVGSPAPGNIAAGDTPPEVEVFIRDLAAEGLTIELAALDTEGRTADEAIWQTRGGLVDRMWRPNLPSFGWYRITARVYAEDQIIGAGVVDIGWIPEPREAGSVARDDLRRLGLGFTSLALAEMPGLADAAAITGSRGLVLPASDKATTPETIGWRIDELERLVTDSTLADHAITLTFEALPRGDDLPEAPPDAVLRLAEDEGDGWSTLVRPYLTRLGQRVRRWQLSPTGANPAASAEELSRLLAAADKRVRRLVPGPVLEVPWMPTRSAPVAPPGVRTEFTALLPGGTEPEGAASMLAEVSAPVHTVWSAQTEPGLPARARAVEAVERLVAQWSKPQTHDRRQRFTLLDGWSYRDARRPEMEPEPALLSWAFAASQLAGTRPVAPVEVGPGYRAQLFRFSPEDDGLTAPPGEDGLLVIWRDAATESNAGLEMLLGADAVRARDLFGNPIPISRREYRGGAIAHQIELGDEPVFVTGVDPEVVVFQSSVRLEPELISSRPGERVYDLIIGNPFRSGVRGRFSVVSPGGLTDDGTVDRSFRLTPRVGPYAVEPGGELRQPVVITLSPAVEAGEHELVVDFELQGRRDYGVVRVRRQVTVGLESVWLQTAYRFGVGDAASDLLVEAAVTNTGSDPISVDLFVNAPGFARQRRSVRAIAPGETVVRVLPLSDGRAMLAGKEVNIGLQLPGDSGRLRKTLRIGRTQP